MDIFWNLDPDSDPDPHNNRCGSAILDMEILIFVTFVRVLEVRIRYRVVVVTKLNNGRVPSSVVHQK